MLQLLLIIKNGMDDPSGYLAEKSFPHLFLICKDFLRGITLRMHLHQCLRSGKQVLTICPRIVVCADLLEFLRVF